MTNDGQVEESKSPKVKKHVEVWRPDFEWFEANFGGASLSWITNLLLHSLRTVCENPLDYRDKLSDLTPLTIANIAAINLKEELDERVHDSDEEIASDGGGDPS